MSNAATESAATMTCLRCGGSGRVRFKHIDGGVCYGCKGTGRAVLRQAKYVAPRRSGAPTWSVASTIDRNGEPETLGHACANQAMARSHVALLRSNARRDGIVIGIEVRNPDGEIVHSEEAY